MGRNSPNGHADWRTLVSVDTHSLGPFFTRSIDTIQIHEANELQPHVLVRVGRSAVGELEISHVLSDEALEAWHQGIQVLK